MILLDTHAMIFLASDQDSLSATARQSILNNADGLYYSSISALEIALLVKRGRLLLPVSPFEFIQKAQNIHGLKQSPVSTEIALASADLPEFHKDPFDRIIIATAMLKNMPVLSMDAKFEKYSNLSVVW